MGWGDLDRASGRVGDLLKDLKVFKAKLKDCVGQDCRILIKRAMQRTDEEWLITILRKMKRKKLFNGIVNSWNALQSAFTEAPFDIFAMSRTQLAMLCYTIKLHLRMHVEPCSPDPRGSLWDFIPEPRLQVTEYPETGGTQVEAVEDEASGYMTCEEEEDAAARQSEYNDASSAVKSPARALNVLKCHSCERFVKEDYAHQCVFPECRTLSFHLECLEGHYHRAHPRAQRRLISDVPDEERVLAQESAVARAQMMDQVASFTRKKTPLWCKYVSIAVALVSVGAAVGPPWSSPHLQVLFLK